MFAALCLLSFLGVAGADDAMLVQTRLKEFNATAASGAPPKSSSMLYRFLFTKTYGADHHCLTEIEFLDAFKKQLIGRYHSQSSCYGCAVSCDGCEENYGDPTAQFDQISSSEAFNAWSCTGSGAFPDGNGNEELQFTLEERPTMVIMKYPHTNGGWLLKDFLMQVKAPDGTWQTVATVKDAPKSVEQFFFVQTFGVREKPMAWPIEYEKCGEFAESPIQVVADKRDPPRFVAKFTPLADRMLADMSTENSIMFAVDGEFGTITVNHDEKPSYEYTIRQLKIVFPATHQFTPAGARAPLSADVEAHIIMQKTGSFGIFDLAVVTLLLDLPPMKNRDADTDKSVLFFRELGLDTLPVEGSPEALPIPVDLSVFTKQFAGGVSSLKCSDEVTWYLLHEPAFLSGSILHALKVGPIPAEADECDLLLGKASDDNATSGESAEELAAKEKKRAECEAGRKAREEDKVELEQEEDKILDAAA